jgi:tetratricopeptide (TPR) repeat protein
VDNLRIEDLRRRVEKDPASIAFAQLAEEYRRAGQFEPAVEVCRAGLAVHPGYLSARVTLGRTLIELGQLDDARTELELVLKSAPENLAARRGLAEIHHRRGSLADALAQYEAALGLARNDPDLEQTVTDLRRQVAPKAAQPNDGLTFEQMKREFTARAVPSERAIGSGVVTPVSPAAEPLEAFAAASSPSMLPQVNPTRDRAVTTIAALEEWLDAINVSRTHPGA